MRMLSFAVVAVAADMWQRSNALKLVPRTPCAKGCPVLSHSSQWSCRMSLPGLGLEPFLMAGVDAEINWEQW